MGQQIVSHRISYSLQIVLLPCKFDDRMYEQCTSVQVNHSRYAGAVAQRNVQLLLENKTYTTTKYHAGRFKKTNYFTSGEVPPLFYGYLITIFRDPTFNNSQIPRITRQQ